MHKPRHGTAWSKHTQSPAKGSQKGKSLAATEVVKKSKDVRRIERLIESLNTGLAPPSVRSDGCFCQGIKYAGPLRFGLNDLINFGCSKSSFVVILRAHVPALWAHLMLVTASRSPVSVLQLAFTLSPCQKCFDAKAAP